MNMAKTNEIQNSYGNSVAVAIANTSLENVLNAYGLPTNSLIITSEYDSDSESDIGNPSMVITDYEGSPAILTRHIEEKNGLCSDSANTNVVYMHIDNSTINTKNGALSLNINNLVDNRTLVVNNNKIDLNVENLDKASKTKYGVVKVDNSTIISDNGTIHVATDKLDYAHRNIEGIAKGDESTIITRNGVLSVNAENLQKASNTNYGVAKPDNTTIVSQSGVILVNRNGVSNLNNNGLGLNKADKDTIIQNNGAISVNENKLPIASNSVMGVVKLDPNSLETDSNNILEIKDYNNTFTYIYDLESGIDIIEQKINYIREYLDNNEYQNNIPVIKHLSCNETTTSILAKPESMEEPINMEMQHVYVSLNVITNCDFAIDVQYENNETPTVELDNINYNDEYTVSGIEALEHTWESTSMTEKNIILLFNCKNFFSTTGPKTKTTKLDIKVSAKADNTKFKNVIYSIIRYNSYFVEPEQEPEPEPNYDTEFIIDESNSMWFALNTSDELDTVISNIKTHGLNYYTGNDNKLIKSSAYLTDPDEKATININDLQDYLDNLFFYGAYINVKTKDPGYFVTKLDREMFPETTIMGKYVYELPYKIKFDTLYYKLRYRPNVLHILVNGKQHTELVLENFKDYETAFSNIPYSVTENVTVKPYIKFNSRIIEAIIEANINTTGTTYNFKENGISYATMNAVSSATVTSYILKYNIKNADIYLVDSSYITETSVEKINLEKLYDNCYAAKITISTDAKVYDANAYLYLNNGKQIKDRFEFAYSQIDTISPLSLYLYANVKYGDKNVDPTDLSDLLCYTYTYYSLIDNNVNFDCSNYLNYNENNVIFSGIKCDDTYCYVVNYNIETNGQKYFKNDKTTSFIIAPCSFPQVVTTNFDSKLNFDGSKIAALSGSNGLRIQSKCFKSINGWDGINDKDELFSHLTISYSYITNDIETKIKIDNTNTDIHKIVIKKDDGSAITNKDIEIICIDSDNATHSYTKTIGSGATSYEIIVDEYNTSEMVLAYVHSNQNIYERSNLVGAFVSGCNLPEFGYAKSSPIFIDNGKFYSYCNLTSSALGRNSVNRMDVSIDLGNNSYSYMSQYSYLRYEIGTTKSYTQNYLYNSAYQKTGSIVLDAVNNYSLDKVNLACSYFAGKSYCGYVNGDKLIFKLGTTDSKNNSTIVSKFVCDGTETQANIALNNNIIYGIVNIGNLDINNAKYLFLNTYGFSNNGLAYYNSSLTNLSYNNNVFTISNTDKQLFYDDCVKSLLLSMCNQMSPNIYNTSDMKLQIYAGRNLTYTIVPSVTNLLTIDENRTTSSMLSFTGLLKAINFIEPTQHDEESNIANTTGVAKGASNTGNSAQTHAQQPKEIALTYIYNIPNLSTGLLQYCICDVYNEYFIPRFTKPFDKYFTPYDYSVRAYNIEDTTKKNILNAKCTFADAFIKNNMPKPRTIKVCFEVKYKDTVIFEKTIDVNKANDFDGVTYLYSKYVKNRGAQGSAASPKTNSPQNTTTYYAYCYYTYNTINKYTYSNLQSYVDINYYEDLVFDDVTKTATTQNTQTINRGLVNIPLTSTSDTKLVDTHQSIIEGSLSYYLTKLDNNGNISYLWKLSDNERDTFNLCQYGDQNLVIVPQLKSDYNLNKIMTL